MAKSVYIFLTFAVLSVSAYLRFVNLGHTGYWIDEMSSIHFSSHPFWGALLWDNSPPLYHFILKLWIAITSTSEEATRSLSALISLGTTILWLRAGYLLHGKSGSLVAGICHSVLMLSVFYARETRMYSLLEFASTLLFLLLILQAKGKNIRTSQFAFAVLLSAFSHYLGLIPIMMAGVWIFVLSRKSSVHKYQVVVLGFGSLVGLIGILLAVQWHSLSWLEHSYRNFQVSKGPGSMLTWIFAGSAGISSMLAVLLISLVRKNRISLLCFGSTLFCILGAVIFSLISEKAIFQYRYFIFTAPWVIYPWVAEISALIPSKKKLILTILILSFSVFISAQAMAAYWIQFRINSPWNTVAQKISEIPPATVFTKLPLSVASPYFDQKGIEIQRLEFDLSALFPQLLPMRPNGKRSLILETPATFYYSNQLEAFLSRNLCHKQDLSVDGIFGDKIIVLEIECPPTK